MVKEIKKYIQKMRGKGKEWENKETGNKEEEEKEKIRL